MIELLTAVHKLVGAVAGEVAIALARRRLHGGTETLARWACVLREAAGMLERDSTWEEK